MTPRKDIKNMSDKKLTPRQKIFAEAYASGKSGTESAKIAGYADKSAGQQANKLISNPQIHTYIDEQRKQVEDSLGISLETCVAKYLELAKLSQTKKDYNTAKQCIDSIAKVMDYNPKEKVQRTENKVQFELLLKQLDQLPEVKEINPLVSDVQT